MSRPLIAGVLAGVAALAGCSSAETGKPEPAPGTGVPAGTPAAGVEVSAAGVTTRVAAPSAATENGFGQACLAAKAFFDERDGDPTGHIEEYLGTVQHPDYAGPGTFDSRWVDLSPGEQAGVILAAESAAAGICG